MLAQQEADRSGQRWISVAFDALDFGHGSRNPTGALALPAIPSEAAFDVIGRIVAGGFEGRLAVVMGDFSRRRKKWVVSTGSRVRVRRSEPMTASESVIPAL